MMENSHAWMGATGSTLAGLYKEKYMCHLPQLHLYRIFGLTSF